MKRASIGSLVRSTLFAAAVSLLLASNVFAAASISQLPNSLTFSGTVVGEESVRLLTITNNGDEVLILDDLVISGADSSEFRLDNDTCSSAQLESGETCTAQVVYLSLEHTDGTHIAQLDISSNDPVNPLHTVDLYGSAKTPVTLTVMVDMPGTGTIANLDLEFENCADTCEAVVPINSTHYLYGNALANYVFVQWENCEPQTVSPCSVTMDTDKTVVLITRAMAPGTISTNATELAFGQVSNVQGSQQRLVEVSNVGELSLDISSTTITGADSSQFTISTDTCSGITLQATESCSVGVTAWPDTEGLMNAILEIASDDPETPVWNLPLSMEAVHVVTYFPVTLGVMPALSGKIMGITVSMWGGASDVSLPEGWNEELRAFENPGYVFSGWTGCDAVASDTCEFTVSGARTVTANFEEDLTLPRLEVNFLTGTFGQIPVGESAAARIGTITNSGSGLLSITDIVFDKGFHFAVQNDTCTATVLTSGESCTFEVVFAPQVITVLEDELVITGNDPLQPEWTAQCQGIGIENTDTEYGPPELGQLIGDALFDFGEVHVGDSSTLKPYTIRNVGEVPLTSYHVEIDGIDQNEFVIVNNGCENAFVEVGETCSFSVAFVPLTEGDKSASVYTAGGEAIVSGTALSGSLNSNWKTYNLPAYPAITNEGCGCSTAVGVPRDGSSLLCLLLGGLLLMRKKFMQ